MHPNITLLEHQLDMFKIKPLNDKHSVFRVEQLLNLSEKPVKRVVKIYRNADNYYALKKQKRFFTALSGVHSGIPKLLGIRKSGMHYLFIFEYLGKQNLLQKVHSKGPYKIQKARKFLQEAIEVFKLIQGEGKIHSRISPSHWVVNKKNAILCGWSHLSDQADSYEHEAIPEDYEALLYSAPERLDGRLNFASDIFSLGLCLYFLLTGEHLLELLWKRQQGLSGKEVDGKALDSERQPAKWQILWMLQNLSLPEKNQIDSDWLELLRWMLDPEPENRPTLEQLAQWLQAPEIVQKVVLKPMNATPFPSNTDEKSLRLALADRHHLFAIYQNAKAALKDGDDWLAFNLFENGVFKNYSLSEVAVAWMYEQGRPVAKSYAQASLHYYQAFQKGNPQGAYALANLLEKGLGVPENLKHAEILYRFAAMRGHLKAQTALGKLYAKSEAFRDQKNARYWLVLAVQRGDTEAQAPLYEVMSNMLGSEELHQPSVLRQDFSISEKTQENSQEIEKVIDPKAVLAMATGLEKKMEQLIERTPI